MDSTRHGPLSSSSKGSRCISARRSSGTSLASSGNRARSVVGSRRTSIRPATLGRRKITNNCVSSAWPVPAVVRHVRLLVDRPQAVELVEGSGWDVNEETSLREAACALVPGESGLPVDAVNEHKALVAGLRP